MASTTQIVKMGALLLSQFSLFLALNFQLFGIVAAYKMMEHKRSPVFGHIHVSQGELLA